MPQNTDPLLDMNQEKPQEDLLPWEENAGKVTEEELQEEAIPMSDKKIIDININSLADIVTLISDREYEYVLIEPEESEVKITFRQDNIDASIKYVKYATYSSIILELKQSLDMVIEVTNETQEGKKKTKIEDNTYLIGAKIVPGENGERVWLKVKKEASVSGVQKKKKISLSVIFGFLTAILFVALVLGGAFIAFIVLNATTIDDVRFFASLGINLNDINTFIRQMVRIIFSILMFICTVILSIGLFKFFFTKKVFRRKKILYGFLSLLLLMLTFTTGSAWMFMEQKVNNLPNWQEQAYGDLKIFDNDLRNSSNFDSSEALLSNTDNLIGPVTLLFDLENFQNNKAREGFNVQKYVWDFGGEIEETFSPQINKSFSEIGNYPVSIEAIGVDIAGQEVQETISSSPTIAIRNTIQIDETLTNSGGKKISLNAQNLQSLGNVEWYLREPISETNPNPTYPEWTKIDEGYQFIPGKIFFDEVYVGLSIINSDTTTQSIDKVIIIQTDGGSEIEGEIGFEQAFDDEFLFTFFVDNVSTNFSDGFIESYEWNIGSKTYREIGNIENPNISPKIEHTFDSYGDQTISVTLTDSKGKTETLSKTITIQKQVQLRTPLIITNIQGQEIQNLKREEKQNEYYINELGVPATLVFDARLVRPESPLYTLQEVSWDINNDGNIDGKGTDFEYEVSTEGNHTISVNYSFQHRRNIEDIITLKEVVYIQGVRKDAILDLQLEYDSNYAPVTVRFDASKSYIKNDDIVKFIYDYGDGIIEERDAINPGHKYTEAGDYTITLTVRGKTGKTYSTSKELILLPPPQSAKITTSLKNAPVGQEIDFSSSESEGQIVEYFWNFGDGNISTEANPSHSYKKEGRYTVTLQAEFSNNNSISDEMEIVITE